MKGKIFIYENKTFSYRELEKRKKSGKIRKIVAPNTILLAAQRSERNNLRKVFLTKEHALDVTGIIHGFVHRRNVVTAATKHIGFRSTIMMDIKDFFDSTTKEHLEGKIDPQIWMLHEDGYTPQGFSTSPMLCNIAVLPMIKDIKLYLESLNIPIAFTMYADDIQISTNTEDYNDLNTIIHNVERILESHNYCVNKPKTRIKYAKFGYRRILGVNVGDTHIRATRKIMRKIRAAEFQHNRRSLAGLKQWAKCPLPKVDDKKK